MNKTRLLHMHFEGNASYSYLTSTLLLKKTRFEESFMSGAQTLHACNFKEYKWSKHQHQHSQHALVTAYEVTKLVSMVTQQVDEILLRIF